MTPSRWTSTVCSTSSYNIYNRFPDWSRVPPRHLRPSTRPPSGPPRHSPEHTGRPDSTRPDSFTCRPADPAYVSSTVSDVRRDTDLLAFSIVVPPRGSEGRRDSNPTDPVDTHNHRRQSSGPPRLDAGSRPTLEGGGPHETPDLRSLPGFRVLAGRGGGPRISATGALSKSCHCPDAEEEVVSSVSDLLPADRPQCASGFGARRVFCGSRLSATFETSISIRN